MNHHSMKECHSSTPVSQTLNYISESPVVLSADTWAQLLEILIQLVEEFWDFVLFKSPIYSTSPIFKKKFADWDNRSLYSLVLIIVPLLIHSLVSLMSVPMSNDLLGQQLGQGDIYRRFLFH